MNVVPILTLIFSRDLANLTKLGLADYVGFFGEFATKKGNAFTHKVVWETR